MFAMLRVPSFYASYLFDVYRYYLGIFHSFTHEFATQKLLLAYYFAYLKELKLYGNPHDLMMNTEASKILATKFENLRDRE